MKFCVKIDKSVSETLALLTLGYSEHAMKKLSVLEWHRRFEEGQDDPRSEQPKTQRTGANVDRVQTLVHPDQRLGSKTDSRRLWEPVQRKGPKLWPDNWTLHRD
jgi:hypothetical protein